MSYVPPKINTEYIFYVNLASQANPLIFQVNPTLATGDVKYSIDGGAATNLGTLPVVTPAGGTRVKVTVALAEMNGQNISIVFSDAAGAEWCDKEILLQTSARQIDDLSFPQTSGRGTLVAADGSVSPNWADVKSPTTTLNLSGTTVKTATDIATQITALLTTAVADSVAADGSRPSVAQALLMITRFLMERDVVSTTMTVNKEDGTTANMTFTLNDSANPTSITRAT